MVSGVEYNVILKFEIDQLQFDGPIDIKFLGSPLLLSSLLPSFFSFFVFVFFPTYFSHFLFFFFFGLCSPSPFFQKSSLTYRREASKTFSTSHVLRLKTWEIGEVGEQCGCVGDPMSPTFLLFFYFNFILIISTNFF